MKKGSLLVRPLIDGVTKEDGELSGKNIFGPVLQGVRVEPLEEAIDVINDHEYGYGKT